MKTPDLRHEEGQSLIQLAVTLVVLIGFVGLAIDGGHLYAERRRMQNAADAGALAGAWEMCKGKPASAAKTKAVALMQQNGDTDAAVGDVDVVGYKVTAHASKSVSPFLPFTFSGGVNVPATAAAACGAANTACGVWPMGMPKSQWDTYEAVSCDPTKANKIAITVKDTNPAKNPLCYLDTVHTPTTGICNCYKCEYNSKPFFLVPDSSPGVLLDFSQIPDLVTGNPQVQNGCGNSELIGNLAGTDTIPIKIGDCIKQLPGNKFNDAQVQSAIDKRAGDLLSLPLYGGQCGTASCTGNNVNKYTVTGFGCATLDQFAQDQAIKEIPLDPKSNAYELNGKNYKLLSGKYKLSVFFMTMTCDNSCNTSCGSTDGTTPPDPNGINATNLVQ